MTRVLPDLLARRNVVHSWLRPADHGADRTWTCRGCNWRFTATGLVLSYESTLQVFDALYEHARIHAGQ